MELLLKKTVKILSFAEDNKLDFQKIIPQLGPLVKNIGENKLLAALHQRKQFVIETNDENSKVVVMLQTQVAKEKNDENRLALFKKEDKSNRSLYWLYRFILQANKSGITYSDLANQFNLKYCGKKEEGKKVEGKKDEGKKDKGKKDEGKVKKLDITNVSHYCRKLFSLKLIDIKNDKICKIAIASKFQDKENYQISLKVKRKVSLEENLEDKQKSQFSKLAIISDPWKYLRDDTLILRELTFTQNILLNFASYEAYLREGLLQSEIASKINKLGERKMLVRSLEHIMEQYNVQSTADRQGRTFSLKFHIKSKKIAEYIENLIKDKKINLKEEIEELRAIKPINDEDAMQEEEQEISSNFNDKSIMMPSKQKEQLQQTKLKLLPEKQTIVAPTNLKEQQDLPNEKQSSYFNVNPRLNQDSFNHIYSYFKQNQELVQELLKVDNDFVMRCMKQLPQYEENDYVKFSELLLKIVNETIEFLQVRQTGESSNANKKVSKKQISRNKLNRYIIILNRINEKKVIKSLKLKKYIINLEKHSGVGEIDKKTLEHILNTFQHIQYIRIIKKDIHLKTIKQNIVRSIIVLKDIPDTDSRVIKAEKTIKKGLLKQKQNNSSGEEEEMYSSSSDSDQQIENSSSVKKKIVVKQEEQFYKEEKRVKSGKQTDITNYLLKTKRNVSGKPEIYFYEEDSFNEGEAIKKKFQADEVKKEVEESDSESNNLAQLKVALSKVNKENCEVLARPHKISIFLTLLAQGFNSKLEENLKYAFQKLNTRECYSSYYSRLCFEKKHSQFKYPQFQSNLCKNLLLLSQSVTLPPIKIPIIDPHDYGFMSLETPSVDQILEDAFQEEIFQDRSKNKMIVEQVKEEINYEMELEKAENNDKIFQKIKVQLNELKGKEIKNIQEIQKENIFKFKSYLLRNPCKKVEDLKQRYPMVDYYNFLTQCVYSGTINLFKIDELVGMKMRVELEKIDINSIDQLYYQINSNYYSHFNI